VHDKVLVGFCQRGTTGLRWNILEAGYRRAEIGFENRPVKRKGVFG